MKKTRASQLSGRRVPLCHLLCYGRGRDFGHWLCMVLIAPAAGFLLRVFMLQHDRAHSSFFGRRSLNDWKGRGIGVLTVTPYDDRRRAHVEHHAAAGNLDERGVGDITTPAVAECGILARRGRLISRIGPAWLLLFKQRPPFGVMRSGALSWISTMATNVAVLSARMIGVRFNAISSGHCRLHHWID
ncbi:fatty acid desaturase [Ensifer sp. MJa1]|uniref:fatty acid desaturase n=1 Tax=Ensifer sp. MJa1 TaxID=2919888 RepID=UPI003FA5306C